MVILSARKEPKPIEQSYYFQEIRAKPEGDKAHFLRMWKHNNLFPHDFFLLRFLDEHRPHALLKK